MTLPTRPLGTTQMHLTTVGIGTWALGGTNWTFALGAQEDSDSIAAIRASVEHGVNWVDTAAVYGLGHAEQITAEALSVFSEADRPYVFTKAGRVWDAHDRSAAPRTVGDPASIRREVEDSLRRLRLDRIDLYQMHRPAEDFPLEDYWGTFVELRTEGKVRAIGLSNHGVDLLARAEAIGHVDSSQPLLSAIESAALEQLPWCIAHGTGVIAYSPMGSGLLTGSFDAERARSLPDNDWRRNNPAFTVGLDRSLRLAEVFEQIARRKGIAQPAAAVAWVLAQHGVTGAIIGVRNSDQIDDWIDSASVELTEADLAEVAAAQGDGGSPR